MKDFKIRCSAISRIMSEPRSKADKEAGKLSETTKTYVNEWRVHQLYGVTKQLQTKEIRKGLMMEDAAIELLQLHHDTFYLKNEKFYSSEHITGTPDLVTDKIIDIKCSWDCFTFPLFEEKLNNAYYWQMQGYMYLTDLDTASVAYCLMNTPEELQYSETDSIDYTQYELRLRIKEFEVKRNDEDIQKIIERVEQIRNYLK